MSQRGSGCKNRDIQSPVSSRLRPNLTVDARSPFKPCGDMFFFFACLKSKARRVRDDLERLHGWRFLRSGCLALSGALQTLEALARALALALAGSRCSLDLQPCSRSRRSLVMARDALWSRSLARSRSVRRWLVSSAPDARSGG